MTSLRCRNVIGGTCTRQILLLNNICPNFSLPKCFSEKKDFGEYQTWKSVWITRKEVQCDIEVPKNLREVFANFPPIFKNINVGRDNIGPFMKEYTKKEGLLAQLRKVLISSYFLENGTISTPLLLLYLDLVQVCRQIYRFVQYTPMKCFNNFVQSAVNAKREREMKMENLVLWQRQ